MCRESRNRQYRRRCVGRDGRLGGREDSEGFREGGRREPRPRQKVGPEPQGHREWQCVVCEEFKEFRESLRPVQAVVYPLQELLQARPWEPPVERARPPTVTRGHRGRVTGPPSWAVPLRSARPHRRVRPPGELPGTPELRPPGSPAEVRTRPLVAQSG